MIIDLGEKNINNLKGRKNVYIRHRQKSFKIRLNRIEQGLSVCHFKINILFFEVSNNFRSLLIERRRDIFTL